jgi:hypothetical protein
MVKTSYDRVDIINPGIFWSNYEVYVITTQPMQWKVSRRYSEFTHLRDTFKRLYPGYMVPMLPKAVKNHDAAALNKAKVKMQFFLDELKIHPVFAASSLWQAFLSLEDETAYESVRTAYDAKQTPRDITRCMTIEGSARIYFNKALQAKCQQQQKCATLLREQHKM